MTTLTSHSKSAMTGSGRTITQALANLFSARRTMNLAVALLVVVAAASAYGILGILERVTFVNELIVWCACGALVFMAIVVLLLGRFNMERSLGVIEQQMRSLIRDGRLDELDAPIPHDLQPVLRALNEYVEQVRLRVDRLRVQKRELDLQMRLADTERRNTEAIIFSISDAVLVIDSFGDLLLANTAAERLFNFRLKDCRNRPLERTLLDGSLVALIKESRVRGELETRRQVEYCARREGLVQTFNITLSNVVDCQGCSRGVVAVFHDITRERELAQIKADFVSSVSHELRTPLSSIKAYVEMLLDGEAHNEEDRQGFLQIIDSETERLQRLIGNILNISRIESGVVDVQREMIHPDEVIAAVLEVITPQAGEKGLQLERRLGESPPLIWADRDMLYQAVLNLVSNAVKYTNPGGRVCVQAEADRENGFYVIAVKDNGIGIKARDMERIFEKFFRSKEAAAMAKGTGLGLNLVKHIVETVHHGEISVASEHGAGTTIMLQLPLALEGTKG